MPSYEYLLYLAAFLFCAGLLVVIVKRNAIMVLIGIELMFNAANLNLVAFSQKHGSTLDGQAFAIFVIIVAVCEAAVGLALILRIYHFYRTSIPDQFSELKG